ncbi:hypothetical protein, partial [Escherichia coli]|uniref:hypothetical protein n=1 Tax=Escherichia coli TaxID=562 RepID=UPI0019618B4F
ILNALCRAGRLTCTLALRRCRRSLKKSKRKLKNTLKQMTTKIGQPKPMGCSKSHSKRKVYSNISPPQETRRSSNKQANFTAKTARERRSDKT